jgi:hypothetical protein
MAAIAHEARRGALRRLSVLRWIREAIDVLLPVASIGGSLASARLLTFWRVSVAMALAGVFADVFLQTVAQALFASAGALLLAGMVGLGTLLPQLFLGSRPRQWFSAAFICCNATARRAGSIGR